MSNPTKDLAMPPTVVSLPDDLCIARLSKEQVRFLVAEELEDDPAVTAIRGCHRDVVAHSTPAMQDVIHIGPKTDTFVFGYGLEEVVQRDCLSDGSEVPAYPRLQPCG